MLQKTSHIQGNSHTSSELPQLSTLRSAEITGKSATTTALESTVLRGSHMLLIHAADTAIPLSTLWVPVLILLDEPPNSLAACLTTSPRQLRAHMTGVTSIGEWNQLSS